MKAVGWTVATLCLDSRVSLRQFLSSHLIQMVGLNWSMKNSMPCNDGGIPCRAWVRCEGRPVKVRIEMADEIDMVV